MITTELLEKAFTERVNRDKIKASEQMALAALYGGDLLGAFIYQNAAEDNAKYIKRRDHSINHFENFSDLVIRRFSDGIFRDERVNRRIKEIDKADPLNDYFFNEYDEFIEQTLTPLAMQLDELYVRVQESSEEPIEPGAVLTADDRKRLGIMPRPYLIFPSSVWSIEFRKDGDIKWIAIEYDEYIEVIDKDSYARMAKVKKNDAIQVMLESTEHGFNEIPVVRMAFQENYGLCSGTHKIGRAYNSNIIRKSIGCVQFISLFVQAIDYHLFYKVVGSQETADATTALADDKFIVEKPTKVDDRPEGNAVVIPTRYLSLPSVELDKFIEIIYERIPDSIARDAGLRPVGGKVSSGVSKIMDAIPELATIKRIAKFIMFGDERIARRITYKYNPAYVADLSVEYDLTFDVRSISEQMQDWTLFIASLTNANLPKSELGIREMTKRVYDGFLTGMDNDKRELVHNEIDNAPIDFLTSMLENLKSDSTQIPEMENGVTYPETDEQIVSGIKPPTKAVKGAKGKLPKQLNGKS